MNQQISVLFIILISGLPLYSQNNSSTYPLPITLVEVAVKKIKVYEFSNSQQNSGPNSNISVSIIDTMSKNKKKSTRKGKIKSPAREGKKFPIIKRRKKNDYHNNFKDETRRISHEFAPNLKRRKLGYCGGTRTRVHTVRDEIKTTSTLTEIVPNKHAKLAGWDLAGRTWEISNQDYTISQSSRPQKEFKINEYDLLISVKVSEIQQVFYKPFGILIKLPDGSKRSFILNRELKSLKSNGIYTFKKNLRTSSWPGWSKFTLKEYDTASYSMIDSKNNHNNEIFVFLN